MFREGWRGVIFNPKIYVKDFGNFKQGFLSMKLIQKSNFRVQGMFFQQLYWKNKNKIHITLEKLKKSGNHLNGEGLCLLVECTTLPGNSLWPTNLFDQDHYKGKMEEKLWVRLIFIPQGVLLWLRIFLIQSYFLVAKKKD